MDTQTIQRPLLNVEAKPCRECGAVKPVTDFPLRYGKSKPGSRKNICGACRSEKDRERLREKNKGRKWVYYYRPRPQESARVRISKGGTPDRCYLCGAALTIDNAHLDHVVPRCKGGSDEKGNLKWACPECNLIKGGLSIPELVERLGKILTHLTSP